MAFERKTWINRQAEFPARRKLNPTGTADVYDVSREEGLILEEGDPFNASTMNALEGRIEAALNDTILPATCTYSSGVFTLSGLPDNLPDIFTVRFKAPSDFAEGDTFVIGSTTFTAKLSNQEPAPSELFKSGAIVTMEVDKGAETAFFKMGGGGFPDGWKDIRTAEATEDIAKGQAIMWKPDRDIEDGIEKLPDPAVLPGSFGRSTAFSPDGLYLAVVSVDAPRLTIYKRSGDTFTKLPDPDVLPGSQCEAVKFSPEGIYLVVCVISSPYIIVYKRDGDVFTKLPNPATLPPATGQWASFSPNSNYLAVAHGTTPFITIYKRSGDVFTKLPNPATLPPSTGRCVEFSQDGNYLAAGCDTAPRLTIYKRSGDTFTKLPDPAALPSNAVLGVAFSPDNNYLAVSYVSTSPFVSIYKRSGDTFTKLPDPIVLPKSAGRIIAFSHSGDYLVLGSVNIYKRSGDTFTKLPDPDILPADNAYGPISFSSDDTYLAMPQQDSPFIIIYRTQEQENVRPISAPWGGVYASGRFLGVSLQSAGGGQPCKVNLFPALNNMGG